MTSLKKLQRTGIEVHPLNLGGNVFGWTADRDASFAVLDAYTAAGGNFIDTADAYSRWVPGNTGGESETIIGEWLKARGNRDKVVIATKGARHPDAMGLKPETINKAIDASLRRLGTDYIDLYYTHYDDESVEIGEIMTALDGLVKAGKARAVAASNISPERIEAALAFSKKNSLTSYVALQPQYNLMSRDTYEGPLREVAERHGLAVFPYYGLAAGFLTGKYRPGAPGAVDTGRTVGSLAPSKYLETERGPKVLAALDDVARARGVEVTTVALAWLAAQPTITGPIASARTPGQLPALLKAVELRLSEEDLAKLDAASV